VIAIANTAPGERLEAGDRQQADRRARGLGRRGAARRRATPVPARSASALPGWRASASRACSLSTEGAYRPRRGSPCRADLPSCGAARILNDQLITSLACHAVLIFRMRHHEDRYHVRCGGVHAGHRLRDDHDPSGLRLRVGQPSGLIAERFGVDEEQRRRTGRSPGRAPGSTPSRATRGKRRDRQKESALRCRHSRTVPGMSAKDSDAVITTAASAGLGQVPEQTRHQHDHQDHQARPG
jgi:hypothetical protein